MRTVVMSTALNILLHVCLFVSLFIFKYLKFDLTTTGTIRDLKNEKSLLKRDWLVWIIDALNIIIYFLWRLARDILPTR